MHLGQVQQPKMNTCPPAAWRQKSRSTPPAVFVEFLDRALDVFEQTGHSTSIVSRSSEASRSGSVTIRNSFSPTCRRSISFS